MPWEKVAKVLEEEYPASRSTSCSPSSSRRRSPPPRSARCTAPTLLDGRAVAVKIQYPGVAEALESDLRNAGMIVRLARALAPGLDAKAVAEELRERVMEELDYEYEAQNQRTFARAYRGHPFIYVPDVLTRLSRRRVLVTEYVEGIGFEEVKELPQEEREPLRRDRLPLLLRLDLPPAALQRRPPPRQLHPDGRRPGRLPRLRDDQEARPRADRARAAGDRRRRRAATPRRCAQALHDLGFVKNPSKLDAERLMEHVMLVGGWYMEDREIELTPRRVMKVIESTSDPRSEYYDLMRRESIPAEELMGRRMETGVLAVLAQLRAKRNWHRIMREWVYADPPATELGEQEWAYFEERGERRVPGFAGRPGVIQSLAA